MKRYLLNVAIGIDQLCNAVCGGSPDETLSAAAWRTEQRGKIMGRIFRPVIDLLFLPIERSHCQKSYESEKQGKHLPAEYHHDR